MSRCVRIALSLRVGVCNIIGSLYEFKCSYNGHTPITPEWHVRCTLLLTTRAATRGLARPSPPCLHRLLRSRNSFINQSSSESTRGDIGRPGGDASRSVGEREDAGETRGELPGSEGVLRSVELLLGDREQALRELGAAELPDLRLEVLARARVCGAEASEKSARQPRQEREERCIPPFR